MWCGVVKGSQTNSWKVSHYLFDYLRKLVFFIMTHAFYFTFIFLLFIILLKKKKKTRNKIRETIPHTSSVMKFSLQHACFPSQ